MKEKGVDKGIDVGGFMLLKIGLKVGGGVLVVMGRVDAEVVVVVILEGLVCKEFLFLFIVGVIKMGLNMGDVEDIVGVVEVEGLVGGVFSILKRIFCLGVGDGVDRVWDLVDVSV